MNSIPQFFAFATILSKSEVTSSVSRGIDGMIFTQMAIACEQALYSGGQRELFSLRAPKACRLSIFTAGSLRSPKLAPSALSKKIIHVALPPE